MTPTKYVLLIENETIDLRGYSKETAKGYFNIEAVKNVTGKSLPELRKEGARLAKHSTSRLKIAHDPFPHGQRSRAIRGFRRRRKARLV